MYKIKINYNTGDSFGTEEGLETTLEFTWKSLQIAKENLIRIKEHYEYYQLLNKKYSTLSKKEIEKQIKIAKSKDWFTTSEYNRDGEYALVLKTDDGTSCQISTTMWVGYFESLNYAEIVLVSAENDNNMKISF